MPVKRNPAKIVAGFDKQLDFYSLTIVKRDSDSQSKIEEVFLYRIFFLVTGQLLVPDLGTNLPFYIAC